MRAGFAAVLSSQPDIEVVGEAGDGALAVREARRLRPDVVVMDIQMPGIDGIEATRQLAGPNAAGLTGDGATVPRVLIVTNFNLDEYVYQALRAGASGFLLKDAPPAELIGAVRVVAAGESLLAPAVTRRLIGRYAGRIRPSDSGSPAAGHPLGGLSPREREVLTLIAAGLSNAEIAGSLFISAETVKTYVSRILAKLGLRDRVQAVVFAYQEGLVSVRD
ncbi:MAG: response regulator transcription factor [Streptosporangiales bacterium]|nr:response regulator transcription factor [Streptosporangiales bacterium]